MQCHPLGLELVVERRDAGEEEIARRENEGQEEIVDRSLSLWPGSNKQKGRGRGDGTEQESGKSGCLPFSLSPRNLSRKNRKEGWKTEGGSRAKEPLDFGGRQGPLRSEIHTDDGRT